MSKRSDVGRGNPVSPVVWRQTLGDLLRRSAARAPARLAICCGDVCWTYAEFDSLCNRLAAGLSSHGIRYGDRVAILARNSHGFAAMRFALARLGAVLVPINFMLTAADAAYICSSTPERAHYAWTLNLPSSAGRRPHAIPRSSSSSGCRVKLRRRHRVAC